MLGVRNSEFGIRNFRLSVLLLVELWLPVLLGLSVLLCVLLGLIVLRLIVLRLPVLLRMLRILLLRRWLRRIYIYIYGRVASGAKLCPVI